MTDHAEAADTQAPPGLDGPDTLTSQEALRLVYLTYRAVKARGRRLRFVRVQFAAASPGDGTSTLARDFAKVAALHGQDRVLLLDLGQPANGQMRYFQAGGRLSDTPELPPVALALPVEEVMEAGEEAAAEVPWLHLHRVGDSSLFVSERRLAPRRAGAGTGAEGGVPEFWDALRRDFALVVVDTPAISQSFDPVMLSSQMDAVILVIDAETTRAAAAQDMRQRIAEVGGHIAGAVLNRRRFYVPEFIARRR